MTKFLKTITFLALPLTLAISAMPASALNSYSLSGNFLQGGNFSGTFDYDSVTDTLSNVNITTPSFLSFSSFLYRTGVTQNFTAVSNFGLDRLFVFSGTGQGTISSTLSILTSTPLLNTLLPGTVTNIEVGANSRETQSIVAAGVFRDFTGGTVTTQVPFEFNPAVGVVLLGLGFGVSKIKAAKKLA
jgi:hypothetical protein